MDFKYRVSVIIPVYNSEKYLAWCIDSIIDGQGNRDEYEIILIDDGSTDESPAICDRFAEQYNNIKVIHQKNAKVSAARNNGMKAAKGKYFCFLDSDDILLPDTIVEVADFFDLHYDEVDVVTYPQIDILRNGQLKRHFRYSILKESGVYDLVINPYITQTRLNIFSKNKGVDKNLYFEEGMFQHEDSCYNSFLLKDKMKIGYCEKGGYVYALNSDNITGNYFYAYYNFEPAMAYYERLFDAFSGQRIPKYIQAIVLNDLGWKLKSNKLYPYHYSKKEFETAKRRVSKLVSRMDPDVIMEIPNIDGYHRYFFLNMRENSNPEIIGDSRKLGLFIEGEKIGEWQRIEINIQKVSIEKGKLRLYGAAKHPICLFEEIEVWVEENDNIEARRKLKTYDSTYSYNAAKEKVSNFRRFMEEWDLEKIHKVKFMCRVGEYFYPVIFKNTMNSPFDNGYKRTGIIKERFYISYEEDSFYFEKLNEESLKEKRREEDIYFEQLTIRLKREQRGAVAKKEQEDDIIKEMMKNTKIFGDKPQTPEKNGGLFLVDYEEMLRLRRKLLKTQNKEKIWLYNDANTNIENGLLQFRHDLKKDDGVKRYYVFDNELEEIVHHFEKNELDKLVQFGSEKHRELFMQASVILTAYAQRNYYCPFKGKEILYLQDLWNYKVVYLQHGILHATLPWQYGNDRIALDKIVVSSEFEKKNMIDKYAYREDEIIDSGMVRLDYIDRAAKPKNRILIAPSWRHYLIGDIRDNRWTPQEEKFMKSEYYQEYEKLFHDDRFISMLEENDLYVDFKLHPIFECYVHLFHTGSDRICLAPSAVNLADYKICITDFSSFVFDFVYCAKPILYFMPDYDKFRSGMHTYRQLDIPLEEGFGKLSVLSEQLILDIKEIINNKYAIPDKYREMSDTFFTQFGNHAEDTYQALKKVYL